MADKLIRVNSRVSVMASQVAYVIAPEFKDRIDVHLLDGLIQYLADCTHELAGQTLPLPRIEG